MKTLKALLSVAGLSWTIAAWFLAMSQPSFEKRWIPVTQLISPPLLPIDNIKLWSWKPTKCFRRGVKGARNENPKTLV